MAQKGTGWRHLKLTVLYDYTATSAIETFFGTADILTRNISSFNVHLRVLCCTVVFAHFHSLLCKLIIIYYRRRRHE